MTATLHGPTDLAPEAVYELSAKFVGRLVRRGEPLEVAEDVVAKVVEMAVRRGGLPSEGYAWVCCRTALLDHYRSRRETLPIFEAVVPDDRLRFEDAIIGRLDARAHLALCRLPERNAEALRLRYVEDLSWAQAADVLGVTPKEAEHLGSTGVNRLRELMGARPVRDRDAKPLAPKRKSPPPVDRNGRCIDCGRLGVHAA